jgi:hypothetical protein
MSRKTQPIGDRAGKSKGRHGSPRVAAWVHEVINTLLEALPVERSFLQHGNATWRFYNQELEHVRPLAQYLLPGARHILRDFLLANRDARPVFSEHDRLVGRLSSSAEASCKALMRGEGFRLLVEEHLARFESGDPRPPYPGGAVPREDFPSLVAERVVNQVASFPSHYADAAFWTSHGAQFLALASGPEFETLQGVREQLLRHDRKLMDWLERKSFDLCSDYDVPAGPVPGIPG